MLCLKNLYTSWIEKIIPYRISSNRATDFGTETFHAQKKKTTATQRRSKYLPVATFSLQRKECFRRASLLNDIEGSHLGSEILTYTVAA